MDMTLKIEKSYKEVHKRKTEASVMAIKAKEVPWYYDIMKFLALGAYPDGVDKRDRIPLGWWQHNTSYVEENFIEEPMMVYIFVA